MKHLIATIAILLPLAVCGAEKQHELMMTLNDRFMVVETGDWSVTVERLLPLRFADVRIVPRKDDSFSLMLYFKCDTPDLAQFNSPEKIERSVRNSSEKYLPATVEKTIVLKKLDTRGWYGCYTVLTDAALAAKKEIPKGEFRYITRGMVRLSPDSALGFSLMSNALEGAEYKAVLDYILSFVKPK